MKLKSIEEVVMTGEMAKCDFCTETKPVARHYLSVKNKHFSDDEKGRYSKYIKYCTDCGIQDQRDQHLLQTIRKEVEGTPAHLVDIRQNADDKPDYKDAVLIDDILTFLTTLEEEAEK